MNFFKKNKYDLLISYFLITLFICIVVLQITYDKREHPQIIFKTEKKYVLPSSVVKNFSFGFDNILADLYWIKAIQDFSIWNGTDDFYVQEYENIATLDPKFSYPYLLGILTFTSRSTSDKNASTSTLEKIEPVTQIGIKNLPDNWEIPFYIGTGFQLIKNAEKSLPYLKIASSRESSPELVKKAYRTYLKNTLTGKSASGQDLVKTIYETTTSETTKKILEKGVKANDLKEILELIAQEYKKKYGVFPSSVHDLITRKMLRVGPELENEFKITFNKYTGEITVTGK
jgi:hypothetical protein